MNLLFSLTNAKALLMVNNLARVFPGHSDVTVSEQISYYLTHLVLMHGNLLVNFHSGRKRYSVTPGTFLQ